MKNNMYGPQKLKKQITELLGDSGILLLDMHIYKRNGISNLKKYSLLYSLYQYS